MYIILSLYEEGVEKWFWKLRLVLHWQRSKWFPVHGLAGIPSDWHAIFQMQRPGFLVFFLGGVVLPPLSWTILLIKIPSECCVFVGVFCLLGLKTGDVSLRKDIESRKCLYREEENCCRKKARRNEELLEACLYTSSTWASVAHGGWFLFCFAF